MMKPFLWSFVVALIGMTAICSCDGGNKEMKIVDAQSALKAHKAFLDKTAHATGTDIQNLITLSKEWAVLSDTLSHHIQPDSVPHKVYGNSDYCHWQDSIANRMERMVDAEIRSFEDVLIIREALGEMPLDTILTNTRAGARKFFDALDLEQLPQQTKEEAVSSYTTLLKSHLKKGIKSKADMLRFIRAEDLAFRGFLVHLHELGNTSLRNITNSTESICELIFKSAEHGQMTAEIPLVYMFMRTNRRIIQNAMTCLDDIKEGRVTGEDEQKVVYLWMMMKPFFPIDDLSLALLSDKQKEDLRTLAHELPSVAARLNKGTGVSPLPVEEMPNEIIKEYVCNR